MTGKTRFLKPIKIQKFTQGSTPNWKSYHCIAANFLDENDVVYPAEIHLTVVDRQSKSVGDIRGWARVEKGDGFDIKFVDSCMGLWRVIWWIEGQEE